MPQLFKTTSSPGRLSSLNCSFLRLKAIWKAVYPKKERVFVKLRKETIFWKKNFTRRKNQKRKKLTFWIIRILWLGSTSNMPKKNKLRAGIWLGGYNDLRKSFKVMNNCFKKGPSPTPWNFINIITSSQSRWMTCSRRWRRSMASLKFPLCQVRVWRPEEDARWNYCRECHKRGKIKIKIRS